MTDALVDCPLWKNGKCVHPDGDIIARHPTCRGKMDFDFEANYPMCSLGGNQQLEKGG